MRVNNVMQNMVQHGSERSVDGGHGPTQPVPLRAAEVRQEHVGVLQVGYQDDVVVDNKEGNNVVKEYSSKSYSQGWARMGKVRRRHSTLNNHSLLTQVEHRTHQPSDGHHNPEDGQQHEEVIVR